MKTSDIPDILVCQASKDAHATRPMKFITTLLMERTGAPLKVCESALNRAIKRNLIDYGVSARTGWLTDKGIELLESSKVIV